MDLFSLYSSRMSDNIRHFDPYPKQIEVINSSKFSPITWMSSCNGAGKTAVGAAINVWHWTGEYPDYYDGERFSECGEYWVLAPSAITLKNGIQDQIFNSGTFEEIYDDWKNKDTKWSQTSVHRGGKLPKSRILSMEKAAHYTAKEAYVSSMKVQHSSGGVNTVKFYHYELGVKKLAAKHNVLFWHCDEVPPYDIFTELKARQGTNKLGIKGLITATPERYADQNMISEAFGDKWDEMGNSRVIVDVLDVPLSVMPHRQQKIDQCHPKDAPAKLHGLPVAGALMFETDPKEFTVTRNEFRKMLTQDEFHVIHGIDFGFNDPTGFCELHIGKRTGVTILHQSISKKGMSPFNFSGAAKSAGFDISSYPCAWPHDGMRRDKDMTSKKISAEEKKTVAQFYQDAGFKMLPFKTKRFIKESMKHSVFMEIESKAQQGLFFIVNGMNADFEREWRSLSIGEDGKVRGEDHVLDSVVCAWQNRQYARPKKVSKAEVNVLGSYSLNKSRKSAIKLGVSPHLLS